MQLLRRVDVLCTVIRHHVRPRWVRPYLRDLYYRRLDQGPEPYQPRSSWPNWDTEAERTAFCHRIGEDIPPPILNCALIDRSYLPFNDSSNSDAAALQTSECNVVLAQKGHGVAYSYVCAFLRHSYPRVPEEWIIDIANHLLSVTQLAFTSASLGLKDLVLYSDEASSRGKHQVTHPPSLEMTSNVLLSIVGALSEISLEKAYLFVRDFLLTPLVDLDVTGELVVIDNPVLLLHGMLLSEGRPAPESRLQHQCSMNTLVACYQVGIYSDKVLLGEAPGETLDIAEQEAARQAIRNLVGLSNHRPPLQLSGPVLMFDSIQLTRQNTSLNTYLNFVTKRSQNNLVPR